MLWVLYLLGAWRYPRRFFGDRVAHASRPGYFTAVAGTGILAPACRGRWRAGCGPDPSRPNALDSRAAAMGNPASIHACAKGAPMAVLRLCVLLIAAFFATTAATEENPEDLLRLGFFPPLGQDIVYRIEQHHELKYAGRQKITEWTHELHMRLTAKEPPDTLAGTFSLRAVTPGPGVETDIAYLFAKAIEGESFTFRMLDLGAPVEIDWLAVKNRILERLPSLTDAETAALMERMMPVFEPDGVAAVMRPLWVSSVAYLRGFRRDGQVSVAQGVNVPAWLPVPGARLEVHGGRDQDSADLLFIWRLEADPAAAAAKLGPELVEMAVQAAGSEQADKMRTEMQAAVAKGVTALEGGIATYGLKPGLMRAVEFEARFGAGDISRRVQFWMTRLKPE